MHPILFIALLTEEYFVLHCIIGTSCLIHLVLHQKISN